MKEKQKIFIDENGKRVPVGKRQELTKEMIEEINKDLEEILKCNPYSRDEIKEK